MKFQQLETNRLYLRNLNPDVYNFIFSEYDDEELLLFFGFKSLEPLALEKDKFNKGLTTYRMTFSSYQLIEKSSGNIIGMCGFHSWFPEHRRAEIGYHMTDENVKNKGYMSEAIIEVIKYGFEKMDLNRIEACVGSKNIPSLRLMEKSGFVKEGYLRSHYCKNGIIEDSLIFGLLKEDY